MSTSVKEGSPIICNVDKSGGHYAKENKPDREREILHYITCVCNLKRKKSKQREREWWFSGTVGLRI